MKVKIAGLFFIMILSQVCISNALAKEPSFTEKDVTVTGGIIAKERTYTESGRVVLEKPGDYSLQPAKGGIHNFRISEREIKPHHEIDVQIGDKLVIEPPTLRK
jgi:hypothetical protein